MLASPLAVAATPGHYLTWGVIAISRTNALIILGMIVLFVLAIVVLFPAPHEEERP